MSSERKPQRSPRLGDRALYEAQIHRLAERRERDRWSVPTELISGVLDGHAPEIAARLAHDLPREGYTFAPLAPHPAVLKGKPRMLHRVDALDAVVWAAYCKALAHAIEPRLGPHLYSYRKAHSQLLAAERCISFLREHVAARRDPKTRGVFVLRRDVRRYDETIATDASSSLWTILRELTEGTEFAPGTVAARMLETAFRPNLVHEDGRIAPLARGMPTGIPSQTIACNIYLIPVDRELGSLPGAFYARFGDDIVFAHADLEVVRDAAERLERGVARLGLTFNTDKSRAYYLTGVGRPHPEEHAYAPVRRFPYLGFDLAFDGLRLRLDKRRMLLRDLFARLDNVHAQLSGGGFEERARGMAQVARDVLDPKHPLSHRYAPWMRSHAMARADLIELDRAIALRCASRLTGVHGVRAWRRLPMRRLYGELGFPSLLRAWDDARRNNRSKAAKTP